MRAVVVTCVAAFCIGLGVTVAYRMQTEAMAVVVGVLCGVGASLPVSLLLLYAVRQSQRAAPPVGEARPPTPATHLQPPQPPQIVVVAPGYPDQHGQPWQYPQLPAGTPMPPRAPRDFTIIGDDE